MSEYFSFRSQIYNLIAYIENRSYIQNKSVVLRGMKLFVFKKRNLLDKNNIIYEKN